MAREVPQEKVSRNAKVPPHKWKDGLRLAVVQTQGRAALCSCGWAYGHDREKVREDAIDRHLNKRHGGMGIRT